AGGIHRPLAYYQGLAADYGIAGRCRWISDYIHADRVSELFLASDLVLLTYSRAFRSASGVLNAAVQFNKPCLVSSGQGSLLSQVQQYRLGITVEPDDAEAIVRGLHEWRLGLPEPLLAEHRLENSWRRNAELVRDIMFGS
ncbi:MAG: glycosyl transferase family 1, partial [Bryobacteraceae bacterium]